MTYHTESIEWLLESPPWVAYRTRRDLLDQPEDNPEVATARQAMLEHPQIASMIEEMKSWPGHALRRHNDADHLLHKLVFLADLGVKASDPGMDTVTEKITEHRADDGMFQIVVNIPRAFGGTDQDQWSWMLCDTPLLLYALQKMEAPVSDLVITKDHLRRLVRENGWPCAATPEIGKFKGPGNRKDPCPYATLISLKALQQSAGSEYDQACRYGTETLLHLWEERKSQRPFLFAMGTGFSRLKAPLIWYDILNVTDVLSGFSFLKDDKRFLEMVDIIRQKASPEDRFKAESVWKAWSGWDFGQKKIESSWITFLALRLLNRVES